MTTPAYRIAAFVAALAAVFGIAFGVGRVVDPWAGDASPPASGTHESGTHQQHSE
ncbi:hypothetical protein ACIGKQ_06555 [Gordonia sp. NPDC062954]|uniref:Uncharacterized protein n=1 Tax=Gordonia aquimaris TaxID=2984863 RepID=A0A9X3I3Y1_9ACTN|nr:hypothetical protein [Gordonia aquimaris]MCX2963626.1 hypothetical protein [Gordonia aquimaris]